MTALLTMPEAPVHEDHLPARPEHKVWRTGQVAPVQPVPVAHSMHEAPHSRLGTGALAPDAGHELAALLWGEGIGHRWSFNLPGEPL